MCLSNENGLLLQASKKQPVHFLKPKYAFYDAKDKSVSKDTRKSSKYSCSLMWGARHYFCGENYAIS